MQSGHDHPSLLLFLKRARRRWRPAAWVFGVSLLLVAALAVALPSRYRSYFKVVVKNERVDPLIGADKQTQGILYVNEISEARINTEIQLLLSGDVLREVVRRSHLADGAGAKQQPPAKREETALRRLERDLTVNAVRNSTVIEAAYESRDRARTAEVLRNLEQAYMHTHRRVHGVPGSSEFFQTISAKYTAELAEAEAEMAAFARTHHIVTLAEQKTLALTNIAQLEMQREQSEAAARKGEQSVAELDREIAALPAAVERGRRKVPNQAAIEQLTTVLVGLENKRAQTAVRYQPEDRFITELDTQIAQTRQAIADAEQTSAEEVSTGANPALDFARSERVRAQTEMVGEQAKVAELGRQLRQNEASLVQIDAQSVAYRALGRRVAELEDLDQTYRKRAEEARMADQLDEQRISNLAVIEEPVEPQLPTSPKRGLIFAVGLVWSLLLGLATAILLELLAEQVQTSLALAEATGVPVLAALPPVASGPTFGPSFPALYLAMQRPASALTGGAFE